VLRPVIQSLLLSLTAWAIFILIDGCGSSVEASELVILQGVIRDFDSGEPLARATIRVEGTGFSTLSNDEGHYRLLLQSGEHKLKFSHISHYSEWITLSLEDSTVTREVSLRESVTHLGTVKVYTRAYDPAQQIIIEAIRRKKDILAQLHDYKYDAYTRFILRDASNPDSSKIFLIAESQTSAYWEQPDKYKEIITARKQTANIDAENVIVAVGEFLNFNRNRIELGDYSIVSPTAKDALDHYNYYLLDTIMTDSHLVFRLELEPKDPSDPLFKGYIHIADSSYDVVAVDLRLSEGIDFPFLSNLQYSQVFAQFNDEYWMPVEIRFGGDIDFNFPIPGIPSKLSFADVASLYDFAFEEGHEKGTFDEYVLEVAEEADDVDSLAWNTRQTVPLTSEEVLAYKRIDSLENLPKPLGKRVATAALGSVFLLAGGADDIFHFNRVEGAYAGLGVRLRRLIPRTHLRLKSGYAFDGEYWQHNYGVSYLLDERRRLRVGLEYHDEVVRRETVITDRNYNPTFLALTSQIDPLDYYHEKGFLLSLSFKLLGKTRMRVNYSDFNQYSTPVHSEYSFFGSEDNLRDNPPIAEGKYRSMAVRFQYDSRSRFKNKGEEMIFSEAQYTLFGAGVEYASPEFIDNDFHFRRYYASLFRRQRLPSLGISSFSLYAGSSDGNLPPQGYFTVDHGTDFYYTSGAFNTLNENNFSGNRVVMVHLNHDFDNIMFRRSNLPLLKHVPFKLSIHGGAFWTDFVNHTPQPGDDKVRIAPRAYSEIGFGLANLTPFMMPINMALYFTWQLSDYDTSPFQISLGVKL